jgi:EpsI family protein
MIWHNRYELFKGIGKPNLIIGTFSLMTSCIFLITGQLSSTHLLREISIILFFFSTSFFFGGIRFTGKLFFIIIYMVLMTSLFDRFLGSIKWYLKLITAFMGNHFVNFIGLDVLRNGSHLRLPFTTIEVAGSCSGVNQLITMFALGIPLAVITQKTFIKKTFIIFISIVIALLMNWIRVILIILWNYNSAKEHVHGPYEIYKTPFIFIAGFIILLFINRFVESSHKSGTIGQKTDNTSHTTIFDSLSFKNISPLIIILAITWCYLTFWSIKPVPLKQKLELFPRVMNEWTGRDINTFPIRFKSGFADEELKREYVNTDGDRIFLYIGYFYCQTNEKEIVDSRYAWAYNNAAIIQSPANYKFWVKDQKVGLKNMRIFSWFNLNGRNIVDTKQAKIISLKDSMINRKNNGSIIILMVYPEADNINTKELAEKISVKYKIFLGTDKTQP